jgi:hypothetical protein
MQKLGFILSVILVICFKGNYIAYCQEEALQICIPLGSLKINPPKGFVATKPSVDFPHSSHFDITCKVCHHTWDYDNQIAGCSSPGCHDLLIKEADEEKGVKGAKPSPRFFRHAYHNSCIECHRSTRRQAILKEKQEGTSETTEQLKIVPLQCEDCHK